MSEYSISQLRHLAQGSAAQAMMFLTGRPGMTYFEQQEALAAARISLTESLRILEYANYLLLTKTQAESGISEGMLKIEEMLASMQEFDSLAGEAVEITDKDGNNTVE
ncbi:MAG: hypothetical protein ACOYD1_07710 [Candidatus Nanopelagicales bacterium]